MGTLSYCIFQNVESAATDIVHQPNPQSAIRRRSRDYDGQVSVKVSAFFSPNMSEILLILTLALDPNSVILIFGG